jgi:queuine tRNA-ribosyltransferase
MPRATGTLRVLERRVRPGVAAAMSFELLGTDPNSAARRGRLRTRHGTVETPVFMPVGTQATVKSLTPSQVRDTGAQILLCNTYHLHVRPGSELIRDLGGLHRFMGWDGPILTDSGGFQVFSLAKLRKLREDGVEFQSHLDGTRLFLGPREVVGIQDNLGSDIAMVLDECPPAGAAHGDVARAVERSARWARACLEEARTRGFLERGHHLFAIVQGGIHEDLRVAAAKDLAALPFPGFAIGGVSVGEPVPEMLRQVGWAAPHLPANKPRYVMGVGMPDQVLRMVALGVDMFDCVLPTRLARNGSAFTPEGRINLRNEKYKRDERPLVEGLDNDTCRRFSRAYLRHLVMADEILACTLLTLHNVHFFQDLMAQARRHLEAGTFSAWSADWIRRYGGSGLEEDGASGAVS